MTTLVELKALLNNASNISAIAREAGCHVRTLYRIRDEEHIDPGISLAGRVAVAARLYQKQAPKKPSKHRAAA